MRDDSVVIYAIKSVIADLFRDLNTLTVAQDTDFD